MSVCHAHAQGAQKRAPDSLELELWMVVNHCVGARSQIQVLVWFVAGSLVAQAGHKLLIFLSLPKLWEDWCILPPLHSYSY